MVQSKKQTFRKNNGRKNRSMRKMKTGGMAPAAGGRKTRRRKRRGGDNFGFVQNWRDSTGNHEDSDDEEDYDDVKGAGAAFKKIKDAQKIIEAQKIKDAQKKLGGRKTKRGRKAKTLKGGYAELCIYPDQSERC